VATRSGRRSQRASRRLPFTTVAINDDCLDDDCHSHPVNQREHRENTRAQGVPCNQADRRACPVACERSSKSIVGGRSTHLVHMCTGSDASVWVWPCVHSPADMQTPFFMQTPSHLCVCAHVCARARAFACTRVSPHMTGQEDSNAARLELMFGARCLNHAWTHSHQKGSRPKISSTSGMKLAIESVS
jgi:hypothetical protein